MASESERQAFEECNKLETLVGGVASAPTARAFKAQLRQASMAHQAAHLWVYCQYDLVNLVRCLLAVGVPPDFCDVDGQTALTNTAMNGALRCMTVLLDAGADVSLGDAKGHTARAACTSPPISGLVE
jgi:hypothetical protein